MATLAAETIALEVIPTMPDPVASAKAAGLRYVSDTLPGIRRRRSGKGWAYFDPAGKVIQDPEVRIRINSLAIPPAWKDVWICPRANGHLQATGRDARGRKQYRYHPGWREVRDETKFTKMIAFAEALPGIRKRVEEDMKLRGMPREKVLAAVLKLLETTLIRVGNEEYAKQNESYGLTTLLTDHVEVSGSTIRFEFRGKSGVQHRVGVRDRRLARIVERCQELPGEELFTYLDENGETKHVDSGDVNDYLREITGYDFTAKDFRTWGGTVLAFFALSRIGPADTATERKKNVVEAVKQVAKSLRNRPATCRKFYIHPAVLETYDDATLHEIAAREIELEEADRGNAFRVLELKTLAMLKERYGAG
jgi:DNA topoisomerase-1